MPICDAGTILVIGGDKFNDKIPKRYSSMYLSIKLAVNSFKTYSTNLSAFHADPSVIDLINSVLAITLQQLTSKKLTLQFLLSRPC